MNGSAATHAPAASSSHQSAPPLQPQAQQDPTNAATTPTLNGSSTTTTAAVAPKPFDLNQNFPPIPLYNLVQHLIKQAYDKLKKLPQKLESAPSEQRKLLLSNYFKTIREQLIRLLVLIRWSQQRLNQVENAKNQSSVYDEQMAAYERTAFLLYTQVDDFTKMRREPIFDLPTAIDVMTEGTYNRLPYCIQGVIADPTNFEQVLSITPSDVQATVTRLNDVIRMNLLKETLPKELRVTAIKNGQLTMRAVEHDEFEVVLTLASKPTTLEFYWRILYLRILVNDQGIDVNPLNQHLHARLLRDLQARLHMKISQAPLVDMYTRLHEVCIRLVMDILSHQAYKLQKDKFQNIILAEYFENATASAAATASSSSASASTPVPSVSTPSSESASSIASAATTGGATTGVNAVPAPPMFNQTTQLFVYFWNNAPIMNLKFDGVDYSKQFSIQTHRSYAGCIHVQIDTERQISITQSPTPLQLGATGGSTKHPLLYDQQPQQQSSLKYSELNMSNIIMKCIERQSYERLHVLRDYLLSKQVFDDPESSLDLRVQADRNFLPVLLIDLFESYKLAIYVHWSTGKFKIQIQHNDQTIIFGQATSMKTTPKDIKTKQPPSTKPLNINATAATTNGAAASASGSNSTTTPSASSSAVGDAATAAPAASTAAPATDDMDEEEEQEVDANMVIPMNHLQVTLLNQLENLENQLNRNVSKILDVLVDIKKIIILYVYHKSAEMLGLESHDHRLLNTVKISFENEKEKEVFSNHCLYIKFPNFTKVYIIVGLSNYTLTEGEPELAAAAAQLPPALQQQSDPIAASTYLILKKDFYPYVHLLLEITKSKKFSICKAKLGSAALVSQKKRKRQRLSYIEKGNSTISSLKHLSEVIHWNTGVVCRYQLLHQLSNRIISYNHNGNNIDFQVPSAFHYLKTICTGGQMSIVSPHSIEWNAFFNILNDTYTSSSSAATSAAAAATLSDSSMMFPIIIDGVDFYQACQAKTNLEYPFVYHLKIYDPIMETFVLTSHMNYFVEQSRVSLQFCYGLAGYPQGISEFLNDLRFVDHMTKLAMHIYQLKPKFEKLHIRIKCLTHLYIVLEYGTNYQYEIHITWDTRKRAFAILLNPTNELKPFLEQLLNTLAVHSSTHHDNIHHPPHTPSSSSSSAAAVTTHQDLNNIEKLLIVLHCVSNRLFLLKKHLCSKHNSWCFIPRACTNIRLIHRKTRSEFGIQFFENQIVVEEIAANSNNYVDGNVSLQPPPNGSVKDKFYMLKNFHDEEQQHGKNEDQVFDYLSSQLNRYISSSYVFDVISNMNLGKSMQKDTAKKAISLALLSNEITCSFQINNHGELEFKVTSLQFTEPEQQYLRYLFTEHILYNPLTESFANNLITSMFNNLLRLPLALLKQILEFLIPNQDSVHLQLVIPQDLTLPPKLKDCNAQPGTICVRLLQSQTTEFNLLFRFFSKQSTTTAATSSSTTTTAAAAAPPSFVDVPITCKQRGADVPAITFQFWTELAKGNMFGLQHGQKSILDKAIQNYNVYQQENQQQHQQQLINSLLASAPSSATPSATPKHLLIFVLEKMLEMGPAEVARME